MEVSIGRSTVFMRMVVVRVFPPARGFRLGDEQSMALWKSRG